VKSLLLFDILVFAKYSTISKRKGSNEQYQTIPESTRGNTTAEQNFLLYEGLQGWNSAA
jgi:hypothetical protein